ncbi:hypothetical protein EYF80_052351 [Liparis tanakae]|uniref:Uncharacterized protein n=1 Tax=Liparis tanakae TaxID=230148 RepID=A0A4Z2F9B5_9TELE|nr:hypothetical protein EYF80_052351 [Liparis tanakae]
MTNPERGTTRKRRRRRRRSRDGSLSSWEPKTCPTRPSRIAQPMQIGGRQGQKKQQKNFFQLPRENALVRRSEDLLFFDLLVLFLMAAKMAASNASFRFFCVSDEHST